MATGLCKSDPARVQYERHRPEDTALYRLVQDQAETFFAQVEAETAHGLPDYVKTEFNAFLDCGILANGFLRLQCGDCHHEKIVAFSCKKRGFCPSCGARRMAESAAHLVDHVIPREAVRQWVISFPIPLRIMLASQPQLVTPVLSVIHRVISGFLIKQAGLKVKDAHTGAVTLIQRFGSAGNLNIHLHCLFLDGVYHLVDGIPVFRSVPPPTEKQLQILLHHLIQRLMKCLTAEGFLTEDDGAFYMSETEAGDPSLAPLQAAACTYRIALGPRAGQKILTLQTAPPQEWTSVSDRCVSQSGFSLHANTYCAATDRGKLERLCRYITRPALANERIKVNSNGDVTLKLKSPYRDGTTHLVMTGLEFMQKLAALVPRPRLNLIRYHGVLAPNAKWRSQIVPQVIPDPLSDHAGEDSPIPSAPKQTISWARLLKRVFNIDMERCPNCQGKLQIIAAIEDPSTIAKILKHLGLPARAPPRAPAKNPAFYEFTEFA